MADDPKTLEEAIDRINDASEVAEDNNLKLQQFIQGAVGDQVELDDGAIPSLRGLIQQVRNQAGVRRFNITYSVNDLTRYEMGAEPLFGVVLGEDVTFSKNLGGCFWRLNVAPTQETSLKVMIGANRFDVVFAAGSHEGTVVGSPDDLIQVDRGTQVEVSLAGYARGAAQLRLTMELLITATLPVGPSPT